MEYLYSTYDPCCKLISERNEHGSLRMLGALVIVFREMLEAGLIVGIVMAATRGVSGRGRWIAFGISAGVVGAALVAAFAGAISEAFQGSGQELFNASVLTIAVLMLMWHNAWMASHGREIAAEMRQVGAAVSEGVKPLTALSIVVGVAVLREGSEVALFLYGIMAAGTSGSALFIGGLLGIVAGAAFSALIYFGLLSIPSRYLFSVTGVLITLLAAGLAAQAVQFLTNAGFMTIFDQTAWDTSWLLSEGSILGRLLHTLVGYTDRPTLMQLIVYAAILVIMLLLARLANSGRPVESMRRVRPVS
jgi:high-affinity iron transporter